MLWFCPVQNLFLMYLSHVPLSVWVQLWGRIGCRGGLFWILTANTWLTLKTSQWVESIVCDWTLTSRCISQDKKKNMHSSLVGYCRCWIINESFCVCFQAYCNRETPKGVIRLDDISKVFQEVKRKEHLIKNIFMLETPHRTYQMQAPTITTMYIWMACLELPVSALKLGTPWIGMCAHAGIESWIVTPIWLLLLFFFFTSTSLAVHCSILWFH